MPIPKERKTEYAQMQSQKVAGEQKKLQCRKAFLRSQIMECIEQGCGFSARVNNMILQLEEIEAREHLMHALLIGGPGSKNFALQIARLAFIQQRLYWDGNAGPDYARCCI